MTQTDRDENQEVSLPENGLSALPEGVFVDGFSGSKTKIQNPVFEKSYVNIGDVWHIHGASDANNIKEDIVLRQNVEGKFVINSDLPTNQKSIVSFKYTVVKYTMLVIFGVLIIAGITLAVFALLMPSTKQNDSDYKYDLPASSIYEVMVGRGYWYAEKPRGLRHHRLPHSTIGLYVDPFLECFSETSCRTVIRSFQADCFMNNESDISVNFVIGGDGNIYEGTGWEKYAYGNEQYLRSCSLVVGILLKDHHITKRMSVSFKMLVEKGINDKKLKENVTIYDYRKMMKYSSSDQLFHHILDQSGERNRLDERAIYDESVLDNSTLRIVTRREWSALQSKSTPRNLAVNPPKMVIIAHTAGTHCNVTDHCSELVRNIQAYHLSIYDDIGYNFLIGGDGLAYAGLGWGVEGAHTKYYNNRSIGISFMGNFMNVVPPKRQLHAGLALIEYGVKHGKIDPDYVLYGHKQLIITQSPGDKLMLEIEKWPHWEPRN